jgi:hypothetical protein
MSETVSAAGVAQEGIDALMTDCRLRPAEARAGWVILDRLRRLNIWTVTLALEEISNAAHLSRRTVQHACGVRGRLVELKYFIVHERRGRPNRYSLPVAAETTAPAGARGETVSSLDAAHIERLGILRGSAQ